MGEWDKQHGWLHSPEHKAADRREAEQELAKVVAALRVYGISVAAAAATAVSSNSNINSRRGSRTGSNGAGRNGAGAEDNSYGAEGSIAGGSSNNSISRA